MAMFLTPESFPSTLKRRVLEIPTDPDFMAAFNGALWTLTDPANWEAAGAITPDEAAAKATEMIQAWWDTETDVP
jgi:hypothetical protein